MPLGNIHSTSSENARQSGDSNSILSQLNSSVAVQPSREWLVACTEHLRKHQKPGGRFCTRICGTSFAARIEPQQQVQILQNYRKRFRNRARKSTITLPLWRNPFGFCCSWKRPWTWPRAGTIPSHRIAIRLPAAVRFACRTDMVLTALRGLPACRFVGWRSPVRRGARSC